MLYAGRTLACVCLGVFSAVAGVSLAFGQAAIPPELADRLEKEKAARLGCKVEVCKAFATPSAGAPISCDMTKTWLRDEITAKVVGGSYVWGYGHLKCTFKTNLDRGEIGKAMAGGESKVAFAEHTLTCDVEDKDTSKGVAFTFKAQITPSIAFKGRKAQSLSLDPVKTEGSSVASAAVTSLLAVDKVSGMISRNGANEMNAFLFQSCKDSGVTVAE